MHRHLRVGSILFGLSISACPDDARRRPIGELCESDDVCESGLCVESLCIDPGTCSTGLLDGSLPPELAHACVIGIGSLTVTTADAALAPGASTEVHAVATFTAPADPTLTYDLTRAAQFELTPPDHVTLAPAVASPSALTLTIAPDFVGNRVTLGAKLIAGDAAKSASADVTITHPAGWGTPERAVDANTAAVTPIALGLDSSGCAHLLWLEASGARLGTARRCTSGWGKATVLAAPIGGATVTRAALSVAPSGDAVATWIVAPPGATTAPALEVWAATFAPVTGWAGLPERLAAPPAGVPVTTLDVAMAGPARAIVAWQEMTADAFPVRARRLAEGGWGASEDVDAAGSVLGIPSQGLRVTLATSGDEAQVIWHDGAATYASASHDGVWAPHIIVIDNLSLGAPIAFGDVAGSADGRVLVAGYGGFDNGIGVPESRIDARLYTPSAGWGEELVVEKTTTAGAPRAAFTATGAALVWPVATVAAPRIQIALGRWTEAAGWSRAVVLDDFPRLGQGAVTPVAIGASLAATWVVYRRVDDDQIMRLAAARADSGASQTPVRVLAADGTLGAFVFATGPSGHGLAVAAVGSETATTLWAVPLYP